MFALISPASNMFLMVFLCTDCPPEVTITPSDGGTMAIGDVLTCTSDSTLSTYTFTDSDGTVTVGNTVTLIEEGSFSFTCTAAIAMDPPCSATASVSGTAVGKKQRSNDHCWCITSCVWQERLLFTYYLVNYIVFR